MDGSPVRSPPQEPATPGAPSTYASHVSSSENRSRSCLLALCLGTLLAWPSAAQDQKPPPTEETGVPVPDFSVDETEVPGRPGAQMVVDRLLMLEHRILTTQFQMLQTLAAATAALQRNSQGGESERRQLVEQTMLFNSQLQALRQQIPALDRALEATRAEQEFPPSVFREIERLRAEIVSNQAKVRERHRELRALYEALREEAEPELLDQLRDQVEEGDGEPEDPFEMPPPEEAGQEAFPESEEEAGERLRTGGVQTPRHLTELFERVPEGDTPRGTLQRYRRYRE